MNDRAPTPPLPDTGASPTAHGWAYPDTGATRDLRIDFMRGFVFLLLFTSHFDFFSWFALIGWERIGVVSSAETFIVLAGYVTGAVYGKRLRDQGLSAVTTKLFARAWTLYKIAFIVAASVALLRLLPGLDTQALTQFRDPVTDSVYPMYPPPSDGFMANLLHVVLLKAGPHQFQVIGLYVVLFLLTPAIFWAFERRRTPSMLLVSWGIWLANYFILERQPGTAELRITGAQFEFAFPLVAWQLIFVHGVAAGYHRRRVIAFFRSAPGRALVLACAAASVAFMLFSWNHPLPDMPDWAVLHWIDPATFRAVYDSFFLKYNLGPGRLLNNAVLLVAAYALLTVAWRPIQRALGWLFIPLGQESMYVFFVHVYLILLVTNTPLPAMGNVWINTAIHAGALLACWWMVKKRFLFRWVPH
jgi:hypothetical protein